MSDYKRYLTQLLALTHRNHPDYQNIRVTVARTEEVGTITEREREKANVHVFVKYMYLRVHVTCLLF